MLILVCKTYVGIGNTKRVGRPGYDEEVDLRRPDA
jgi:hypothetical protein